MTARTSRQGTTQTSREHINALRAAQAEQERRKRLWVRLASVGATLAVIGVIVAMMLSSRQETSSVTKVAPDFTLTDTSGTTVSLASFKTNAARTSCCTSARAPAARPAWSRWPRSRRTRASPPQG